MKLDKGEKVGSFFTKIAQVRNQLIAIGITVDDDDLVQTVVDVLFTALVICYQLVCKFFKYSC